MLILTRRIKESLMIGDDVQITILGIKGNQVRIGIEAPGDVPVHRKEVWTRIQKENQGGQAVPVYGSWPETEGNYNK